MKGFQRKISMTVGFVQYVRLKPRSSTLSFYTDRASRDFRGAFVYQSLCGTVIEPVRGIARRLEVSIYTQSSVACGGSRPKSCEGRDD
jgi:hypothetical protein